MVVGRVALALMTGGCAGPGITENPLDTPAEGPPVVSVCYAPLAGEPSDEIERLAREACAAAGVTEARLQHWKSDHILNDCPLLKKSRISYHCLPAPVQPGADGAETGGMP
ncbi:MAG: hypothetical protein JSU82_14735 [Rhodospirillales bacterium]|nr:MAG: hypothetical protein JSU82_14735 [Rhodospirillales bacterium]